MKIETLKSSRDIIVAEIERAGGQMVRDTNHCRCPFHDDKNPSAGISYENGTWLFCCQTCLDNGNFRGGTAIDIRMRESGKSFKDVAHEFGVEPENRRHTANHPTLPAFRPPAQPNAFLVASKSLPQLPKLPGLPVSPTYGPFPTVDALVAKYKNEGSYVAHWEYTNPETKTPDLIVIRKNEGGRKTYTQASPGDGGFVLSAPKTKLPLFNREGIACSDTILVVEGEKCVEIANGILPFGYTATTSPMGAGKASHADWTPLSGKRVVLWADNDGNGKGEAHMNDVAEILFALPNPPTVSVINIAMLDLPLKSDIEQWVEAVGSGGDLDRALILEMDNATIIGASKDLRERMDKIGAGKFRVVDYPNGFRDMTRITNGTLPGTVTVWCGWPGSRKSFLILDFYLKWHELGHPVALLELEEDRAYWQHRVLALAERNSNMADIRWMENNQAASDAAFLRNQKVLNSFGSRITDCKIEKDQDWCVEWVQQKAGEGCRFILVDPVSMLAISGDQARSDLSFVTRIKNIAREYDCTIDLVTHPPKSAAMTKGRVLSLADVAGGSAYTRYAQTVFWVEGMQNKKVNVEKGGMRITPTSNSAITVMKARNGSGAYRVISAYFDPATLSFAEQGVIVEGEK